MNRTVEFIVELVKIRDNILHIISNDVFSLVDIRDIISFLCTSRFDSFRVLLSFCMFVCTPCTILY